MKELLEFIVKGILGEEGNEISQEENDNFVNLSVKVTPENTGLIIGRGGSTIKAIRNILRVRATLEKKGFSVNIV
jgi:predicted RNA-binding protein YlqC (UPF0109 family)